ncbi:PIN domain-containing protein [Candidatus Woesearchaeota archaeon]|nr:PIN domain-containing protein [Candidatus Woesearchaeota archaeon]
MTSFVVDASAWVEYFNGSKKGEKVKSILENDENKIYTNIITIAELSSFFEKKEMNFSEARKIILSISSIYTMDVKFAEEVGKIHTKIRKERTKFGLADAFVLHTAQVLSAMAVTADEDFRGFSEVLMIR